MVDTARAEAALRRDATLEAVAFAAQRFLESPSWAEAAPEVLRRLGEAVDAHRVYIVTNRRDPEGQLRVTMTHEWAAPHVPPLLGHPNVTDAPMRADGFGRWEEVLGRGGVLHGLVRDFPELERAELEMAGARSILVVPIFVDQEWWGYIGFDDCETEREWTQVEIDALRTAAGTIGAAVQRQRTEEQLRQAEARYREIVERTPAISYQELAVEDYSAASAVIYVSPQVERLLGYPAESWWKVPGFWTNIVHPDDLERVMAESDRTSRNGEPYVQEYRMVTTDGRLIWFRDEAVLIRGESGRPDVWQGVMIDISEQKRTEERVRAAESRFRALVEHIPAVTYREAIDANPEDFYISPQVQTVFGYTPQEWTWTPNFWLDRIHPDDVERVSAADRRTNEAGEPYEEEYRFRRADGSYVWVHEQATLVAEEDGPGFWQGFMLDITERMRAEEALQRAETRYRALVEEVPAAMYTQVIGEDDPSVSRTVYISPQAEALIGYTVEETLADPELWRAVIHPDDQERVAAEDAATNESGGPFESEYRMITKDGRIVWIHDQATLVRDEEGATRFWQGFMTDVTERKRAEAQLERALLVERQAAQRLRALDEMKNTFLQAVSHDLRTPLAAILGLAVTLERPDLQLEEEESRDLARRIATNARKLDRMVVDLLDLDRLARGIVEPKLHPTDVGALVRRVAAESDLTVQDRLQVDAPAIVVNTDASKVERIVENLIANTMRHTPVDARVWIRVEPAEGGVLLAVEDEGPGIPEAHRESIFEPFRQGPGAPEHSPGVGVGLTLVARFAELLGGRAWVQDREGGGASFRVFLADGPETGTGTVG